MFELLQNKIFIIMVVLLIVLLFIQFARRVDGNMYHEGFEQKAPFVLKNGNDIYDSFYTVIYDDLNKTRERAEYECSKIIELTHPSLLNSIFLDIGSGTGHLVNTLTNRGYDAHGVDISKDMVEHSHQKFPKIQTKCGDAMDPLLYDQQIFTHITCMNYTIYHIKNKQQFFRNCYHWLIPNGYLILHLVDKDKYNPIAPMSENASLKNATTYGNTRKTDAKIDFDDFTYTNSHEFKSDNSVVLKESFTDNVSKHVRQNELTMYMENKDDIINIAKNNGFLAHALINLLTDDYQYIYVFERML